MESCFLILNNLNQGHGEVKWFAQHPTVYQQKYWVWKPHVSIFPAYEHSKTENPEGARRTNSSPNGIRQEEVIAHTHTLTQAHAHTSHTTEWMYSCLSQVFYKNG